MPQMFHDDENEDGLSPGLLSREGLLIRRELDEINTRLDVKQVPSDGFFLLAPSQLPALSSHVLVDASVSSRVESLATATPESSPRTQHDLGGFRPLSDSRSLGPKVDEQEHPSPPLLLEAPFVPARPRHGHVSRPEINSDRMFHNSLRASNAAFVPIGDIENEEEDSSPPPLRLPHFPRTFGELSSSRMNPPLPRFKLQPRKSRNPLEPPCGFV